MSSTITLVEAIAIGMGLMLAIAFYRRLVRTPKPPAFLNMDVVAFGAALLMTVALVASAAFEAVSIMPFIHSPVWSGVIALTAHIVFWVVARLIIPLRSETTATP